MIRIAVLALLSCLLTTACANEQHVQGNDYFITLSDLHFDPFIACYKEKQSPCPLIKQLQAAPAEKWQGIFETYDQTQPAYRLDTNYPLLQSSLKAAADVSREYQAKFVLVLGDFLGHDYRRYYKKYSGDKSSVGYAAFVRKTLAYLSLSLKSTFNKTPVIPVVGNNDTYTRDYQSIPKGAFFADTANAWQKLLDGSSTSDMMQTFPYAGYYAVNLPGQPAIKVIALNSVLFSYKSRGDVAAKAARQQIAWLSKELADAKQHSQHVIIAMHIPLGIDVFATLRTRLFTLVEFWRPEYAAEFKQALQDYASTVVGVFTGHLHSDWFQILELGDGQEIAVTGTPAISPMFGNNPGFKVYRYASDGGQVEDFYTYYLPIQERNKWGREYEFDRTYQPNCQHCSLLDGMRYLRRTGGLSKMYQRYYLVGGSSLPISANWDPYYWCDIHFSDTATYRACVTRPVASR